MYLRSSGNDVAATDGVTLGGTSIEDDGAWKGKFSESLAASHGRFTLDLPPATAVVVHLQ
jgi:hypothetical protein